MASTCWTCSPPSRYPRSGLDRRRKHSTLCCRTRERTRMETNINLEILRTARENFIQEISLNSKDKDVSLAKALLYVAAEDEAFMAFNREMDAQSLVRERKDDPVPFEAKLESGSVVEVPLAGKNVHGWLKELDMIVKEVEAELVSRDIGCNIVEVLEAVNVVLFELRGFKRFPILVDTKFSYLHTALTDGRGSAIILSIIYLEICRRLGIVMKGSCVGEDFLIWPQTGYPEELFKAYSAHSLFAIVNGRCVEDPRSKASYLDGKSLIGLDIATNRDIIGITLTDLIFCDIFTQRLHWKRAARLSHGLMLTSPLNPLYVGTGNDHIVGYLKVPLLRPRELRLATMASERLLILQPNNWVVRRDHGMLLFYNRSYGEAVQELSICMAFAPAEESKVLEPFVEKLHLLRLESSWKSLEQQTGFLTAP